MKQTLFFVLLAGMGTASAQNIGNFTSVQPTSQGPTLVIPSSHKFQVILQAGDNLSAGGTMPVNSDFCGYVSQTGSSRQGTICVNSEFAPGGVTVLDVQYDSLAGYWQLNHSEAISFSGAATAANCSGGITPWRTMVTCEETDLTFDINFDGKRDYGWPVEINPFTRQVKDYNSDGNKDKVWGMGHMKHENVCFREDSLTVYEGEDNSSTGFVFKYILNTKANLSSGTLYVLVRNGTTGSWVQIPNTTNSERNDVIANAITAGGTYFDRVEDVEVGPDGKVYFASTSQGKIFRFDDDGTTISNFQTFVSNSSYTINYGSGTQNVAFDSPDNIAFDSQGNMWVTQDGGGNYLWMVKPGHTAANPQIEIFAVIPSGAEPTGIYFTPDGEFLVLDIQHPSGSNASPQVDAAGQSITMDADATVIIALNENWGAPVGVPKNKTNSDLTLRGLYPNPAADGLNFLIESDKTRRLQVEIFDITGKKVCVDEAFELLPEKNKLQINIAHLQEGIYQIRMISGDKVIHGQFIKESE
ncbi:MAG: hypothetical protein K0S33_2577 [Bacteroidetes bacterium]|jgi:secreted PhoX family phosphatase|nr:hypothetical protein [Bacteroidota bacterium]